METFLNVADPGQLQDAQRQAHQDHHTLHLFGGGRGRCEYHYSKRLNHKALQRQELQGMIARAVDYAEELGEVYNFDAAKAEFQGDHPM